ncbi:HAD family hydrolase [Leifsonia virtsii]|uniref:HAD hydrolase-like protein n=1 Tax=Leifsonia virtsii TaxID=3035915 RepID=A0ABT8IY63_9MICO|nr:HAD family hydrolase [Leifsonia virtsii]MDN4596969.1 HAD hydrolase-like protein [Leifsonia virtsii]
MTPDGRITSEFDDLTVEKTGFGTGVADDEDWDAFDDGLDDDAAVRAEDRGDDGRDDDLADLELVVLSLAGTTLLDDGLVERAFERAADAAGIAPAAPDRQDALDFARQAVVRSPLAVFRTLTGDDDQAQHAAAVFSSAYADLAAVGGLAAVPGAEDVIRLLRATGVKVALVTGLSQAAQDAVLDAVGWRDLADVTLSADDGGRARPFPDLPLTALLRTRASSVEGMVVVGDTPADIASGIAAGAGLVVGVLTGAHDERTLLDAGADAVLPSVADLPELLGYHDLAGLGSR